MNKQIWKKKCLLFEDSYASNPTAIKLFKNIYRVFYSSRDKENKSSLFFFDFDIVDLKITNKNKSPVFKYNAESDFFSSGITPGCIYSIEDKNYLAFMGWTNNVDSHWYGNIGSLEIDKNFEIIPDSERLLLGLNDIDKVSLSYPEIISINKKYYMFYGSTVKWEYKNGEMLHTLNFAESKDGKNFIPKGKILNYKDGYAQAFSRPTIYIDKSKKLHMWYSYRGSKKDTYKIGYAYSDGTVTSWVNQYNENQISKSDSGWDSQMVEYPNVFEHDSTLYMLYNGNGFGKTGIGIAYLNLKDL